MIDFQDDALNHIAVRLRFGEREANEIGNRLAEGRALPGFREPRCDRCENIAAVEGVAHRLAKIVLRREIPHMERFSLIVNGRKNSVVRTYKVVLISRYKYRAARCSDAWVDHDYV